jgi:phosphoglycolate phosphatase-like HAD superfamily hydrolase
LAVIGDGRAEIEYARAASGLAIGVASTEDERAGIDAHKRSLLIAAGADVIIPDFSQPAELLAYLWPAGETLCLIPSSTAVSSKSNH